MNQRRNPSCVTTPQSGVGTRITLALKKNQATLAWLPGLPPPWISAGIAELGSLTGDILEIRVWVKEGKKQRILLLETSSAAPQRRPKGYATEATHYDVDDAKSSSQRR